MHYARAYGRMAILACLLLVAIILFVPLLMRVKVARYDFAALSDVPQTDVAIVLGASVYRGEPSPVLAARADEAVQLYEAGKVKKILVSGDNGALNHNEVDPVKNYLLQSGIPGQDIFLDHAGFDTYDSMYRARAVFGVGSATIVTQDFHMPRALFIARSLGINAYGLAADEGGNLFYDYAREIPASWKALVDIALRREPKYLGPQIPLSGDGAATWY